MSDSEEETPKYEDLLCDGLVLKRVKVVGRPGPRPEWGDEVHIKYWLRERAELDLHTGEKRPTRILRLRNDWTYVLGDDDASFLPRRFAEIVLRSMLVGEKAIFVIDTRCFSDMEPFLNAPWLQSGTDGYERADVEQIEYEMKLLSLRKGEAATPLVPCLNCSGTGNSPAITIRRPLGLSRESVSLPTPEQLALEEAERVKITANAKGTATMSDKEAVRRGLQSKNSSAEVQSSIFDADTTVQAESVLGPHPGPEFEVEREKQAEQAIIAASRRARIADSQRAGWNWHPWGDNANHFSTWNKVQETREQAGLSIGTFGSAKDTVDLLEHHICTGTAAPLGRPVPQPIADQMSRQGITSDDPVGLDCETPATHVSDLPSSLDCPAILEQPGSGHKVDRERSTNCTPWDFGRVRLQVEAYDARGFLLIPRHTATYIHGQGEQADCIELAVSAMSVEEDCEVLCFWRPGIGPGPALQKDPWLPVSFRIRLESIDAGNDDICIDPVRMAFPERLRYAGRAKHNAALLCKQRRYVLAYEKYKGVLSFLGLVTAPLTDVRQRRMVARMRRQCQLQVAACELKLELWDLAKQTVDAMLKENYVDMQNTSSARLLVLRGRALLATDPQAAGNDFERAVALEPSNERASQWLARARKEVMRQRRAKKWFDGQGIDTRTAEANDAHVCFQCNRYRPGGRYANDKSKGDDHYYCLDCWECWIKIRRCQQRELDKRVDKAIHSDYSTHTDELPSLDDVPRDWDASHPMWNRDTARPDWQLCNLDETSRRKVLAYNTQRAARQQAALDASEAEQKKVKESTATEFLAKSEELGLHLDSTGVRLERHMLDRVFDGFGPRSLEAAGACGAAVLSQTPEIVWELA